MFSSSKKSRSNNVNLGAIKNRLGMISRSSVFSQSDIASKTTRHERLEERLRELVIFEMTKDGNRNYHNMTLRSLYNYVLGVISCKPNNENTNSASLMASNTSSSTLRRRSMHNRALSISLPDHAAYVEKNEEPYVEIDGNNHQQQRQQQHGVTYRERLGGYLHPRDMRKLVLPFTSSNEPELIVRRHVMLLNFDPLRAIILRDKILVLVPDGADKILIDLEKSIGGGIKEFENQVFGDEVPSKQSSDDLQQLQKQYEEQEGKKNQQEQEGERITTSRRNKKGGVGGLIQRLSVVTAATTSGNGNDGSDAGASHKVNDGTDSQTVVLEDDGDNDDDDDNVEDEFDELHNRQWIDMPFELQCVDAILQLVVKMLSDEFHELQDEAYADINLLLESTSYGDSAQDTLRRLKNTVDEMNNRVQGFVRAMNLTLDEDEDMALMNLSRLITHPERFIQPVPTEILHEESDEPELILETYLQQGLTTSNALELLRGHISTMNELINQKLDTVRNRLLYVNTITSLLTFGVTLASLVGSFFGMNLTNHIEEDNNAFIQVVSITSVGIMILVFFLIYIFQRIGALPTDI